MKTLLLLLLMTSVCYADIPKTQMDQLEEDYGQYKYITAYFTKEITESRKREDLLLKEVKLLEYEIDVIDKKDTQ